MSTTMTITVPPPAPTVRRPGGDPGAADALAEDLYAAAGRYEEVADEGQRAGTGGWWGQAHAAYAEASARAGDEHSRMHATMRRVAHAVTGYADDLREQLVAHADLVERAVTYDRERDDLLAAARSSTHGADPALLLARAQQLTSAYDLLRGDDDALQRRVRDSETTLRQVLEAATSLDRVLREDGGVPEAVLDALQRPGAPGTGASPEQVHDWWQSLDPAVREALVSTYPALLGQADGLPAGVRDEANRISLDADLATWGAKLEDGTISEDERRYLENALRTRQALDDADAFTDPLTGEHPGGTLLLYDPRAFGGDGRVAVGVGDLDTADDLAVLTPGISSDTSDVLGYTDKVQNVYESARYNGDGSSVATLFWLGYDAPQGPLDPATFTEGRAEDGGQRLADLVDGLRATRRDDPGHLTLIGHSYGSTTTAYAVGQEGAAVDDTVLIGSPGAGPAGDADDLGGRDHVFVGRDSRDGVAFLGDEGWVGKGGLGLGRDPSSEDFDATRFEAEHTGRERFPNLGAAHIRYLDHDTESLYNIGRIVDGHGDDVNVADHSHDPWYGEPEDPEWSRDPSSDERGASRTRRGG